MIRFSQQTSIRISLSVLEGMGHKDMVVKKTKNSYTIYDSQKKVLSYHGPLYSSWGKFLRTTNQSDRLKWCAMKAKAANSKRRRVIPKNWDTLQQEYFMKWVEKRYKNQKFHSILDFYRKASSRRQVEWLNFKQPYFKSLEREEYGASIKLTRDDIWVILEKAKGRCFHCNSLALEKSRYADWMDPDEMNRRVGSLDHLTPLSKGGDNNMENLVWSCLACNTNRNKLRGQWKNGFRITSKWEKGKWVIVEKVPIGEGALLQPEVGGA